MGSSHWLNRCQVRANVAVLSIRVGEIENVSESGPLVGSDEIAAQEKQSHWHKLHIYRYVLSALAISCGSSVAVLIFFRQISPARILHREPSSFRSYDVAELYWEVTHYFRGTI
jgi:hypothetical protein